MIVSRTPTAALHEPAASTLDGSHKRFVDVPFFAETITLLCSVRDKDFDTLAALCDDDFGIVDVDLSGAVRPIWDRDGWEHWFHELFFTLDASGVSIDSRIDDYQAIATDELGYSVVDYTRTLTAGGHVATFECIATIVWKRTIDGWREARWHASVISSDVHHELKVTS